MSCTIGGFRGYGDGKEYLAYRGPLPKTADGPTQANSSPQLAEGVELLTDHLRPSGQRGGAPLAHEMRSGKPVDPEGAD